MQRKYLFYHQYLGCLHFTPVFLRMKATASCITIRSPRLAHLYIIALFLHFSNPGRFWTLRFSGFYQDDYSRKLRMQARPEAADATRSKRLRGCVPRHWTFLPSHNHQNGLGWETASWKASHPVGKNDSFWHSLCDDLAHQILSYPHWGEELMRGFRSSRFCFAIAGRSLDWKLWSFYVKRLSGSSLTCSSQRKFRRYFRVTNSREEMPMRSQREQMWIRRDVKEKRCRLDEMSLRRDVT